MSEAKIGARIDCEESRGTIKWIGEIPSTKDLWYGIDWDDKNRGKHDGSHGGVRYFDARCETSGSFIRPSKVNLGISLEAAVRGRYQDDTTIEEELTAQLKRNIKARFVEVVGMEKIGKKQSQLETISTVVLDGLPVYGGGNSDLKALLPQIRDLDLSNSLLSSWEEIARITQQLPTLRFLNVSGNHVQLPPDPSDLVPLTSHLTHVVLNKMMTYTWDDLLTCAQLFPFIRKIQLAYNQLISLGPIPPGVFESLEDIDIGVNPISDWSQICYLGLLPKLRVMNLNNCRLTMIEFLDAAPGEKTHLFPKLSSLIIASNPLSYWDSVSELDKLLSLEELILSPEALEGHGNFFMEFTFARTRNLKILNRTIVTPREKRDYALFYLRTFSNDYYANGGTEDADEASLTSEFVKKHPSFLHLVRAYGAPSDERHHVSQKSQRLRDLKIELRLVIPENVKHSEFVKSFLPSTKISKVKMMIKRLLKLDGALQLKLSYSPTNVKTQFEISLENDMQDLQYYSVNSGDTVYIRW